ncbi:EI24-domain-containing protein [Panus rudis PR-1116 ss-1]|nr:EI24-domain-containing protein [Panus rudis PR-1116 ss-1]
MSQYGSYPAGTTGRSRSSYPTFLPVQDTAILQLKASLKGLLDASRWDIVIRLVASDPEIRANILKSLLLNFVSLASIYFFDLLLSPLANGQQKWLHRNVGWFYQILWLLPVVGVSFYLNSTWCTLIAKRTFTLQHGSRAAATGQSTYTGLLNSIASSAYRVVMVFTSIAVSFMLQYIPYVGPVSGFVFLCWIDAYYCFEFIWIARGLSLSRRLRHLEERWAYYFAFGLPTAALCMWGSSLANAALFALVFPAYIIMAMHAKPLPIDPYNPSGGETLVHPSPYIPIRIPIFAPVTFLNDLIIRIISVGSSTAGHLAGGGHSRHRSTARHSRTLSDDVDSVEEGEAVPMSSLREQQRRPPPAFPAPQAKPATRVKMGARGPGSDRRKLD